MRCARVGCVGSLAIVVLAAEYAGCCHSPEFDEAACIRANMLANDSRCTGSAATVAEAVVLSRGAHSPESDDSACICAKLAANDWVTSGSVGLLPSVGA